MSHKARSHSRDRRREKKRAALKHRNQGTPRRDRVEEPTARLKKDRPS
jgi:hypothetical protein